MSIPDFSDLEEPFRTKDVEDAYLAIKDDICITPILTFPAFDSLLQQVEIYFKAELFQKTGSFKFRGACHALARLSPSELKNGVVTHSSGNHAIALAYAAKMKAVQCDVVMVKPSDFGSELTVSRPWRALLK
jgi:threonine dehydratase